MRTHRWPTPVLPGEQMGPPSGYVYMAFSDDDGMSWSWPRNTKVWGYPPDVITLPDGAVLAAVSYRTRPMAVHIALSADAETWLPEDVFPIATYDPESVTLRLSAPRRRAGRVTNPARTCSGTSATPARSCSTTAASSPATTCTTRKAASTWRGHIYAVERE